MVPSRRISQPQALHLELHQLSPSKFQIDRVAKPHKSKFCQKRDEEDEEDESAKFGEEKEADEAEGTGAETKCLDRGAKKTETEEAEVADQAAENEKGGEAAVSSSTFMIAI